eukprot:1600459-Amphidinium_carterae.1
MSRWSQSRHMMDVLHRACVSRPGWRGGWSKCAEVVETYMYVATLPKWMRTEALHIPNMREVIVLALLLDIEAVGCWAYRAQKKMVSAKQLEKKAKVLTARQRLNMLSFKASLLHHFKPG